MIEYLCRKCPNKCKQEAEKGSQLRYCTEAPEGSRNIDDVRRRDRASKKAKKTKPIKTGSSEVVWNVTDWKRERNLKEGAKYPVGNGGQVS